MEETVLWPAVRASGPDGEELTARVEEDLLLSRLHDTMDTGRLRTLGTTWAAVRQSTPTQPHPVMPRRPPGNALLGVPLSDALGIGSSASRRRR
ncbi:hypothetical protein [Streptomyces sp. NRRL S-813]|uniref:hypothetical protein n=1 Tax=Streptomyces sp. NRRL S-813 TaxID=1463919 RepID=UPI00131B7BFF|nr:hypothetical protein [Streptomyces sp. NRRL S-813]